MNQKMQQFQGTIQDIQKQHDVIHVYNRNLLYIVGKIFRMQYFTKSKIRARCEYILNALGRGVTKYEPRTNHVDIT